MKKITFFLADMYKVGGVQRVVSIIANLLADKYLINICSLFAENTEVPFELDSRILVEKIYTEHFDLRKKIIKGLRGTKKYIKTKEFDIIIVCGMGLIPVIFPNIIGRNIRMIAWEHQCFTFGKKFGFEWIGKHLALKYFNDIIVLTKKDYKMYTVHKSNAKIWQIYNPLIDNRNTNIVANKKKRIISVGSLVAQKGFDYAIQIARNVFSELDTEWEWDIYGEGPEKTRLQQLIEEMNLVEKIHLCGYCKNMDQVYQEYSIYCMTSRHEGFPMVLLEAAAANLPIISFDCNCGPSDIITNGINGYLIKCYDIDAYSEKLKSLIVDENQLKKLEVGRAKCENEISLNRVFEQWNDVLN